MWRKEVFVLCEDIDGSPYREINACSVHFFLFKNTKYPFTFTPHIIYQNNQTS